MKRLIAVIPAAALLTAGHFSWGADEALPRSRAYCLTVRVWEAGVKETAPPTVYAEPTILTEENLPFHYFSGGEFAPLEEAQGVPAIRFGTDVQGRIVPTPDGKVWLDVTVAISSARETTKEHIDVLGESMRTVTKVTPGEKLKVRVGKGRHSPKWLELKVEESKKQKRASLRSTSARRPIECRRADRRLPAR